MRILFVVSWFHPAKVGGVAQIMYLLGAALARQGHQVEVWTTDYLDGNDRVTPREQVVEGMKVTYFPGLFHQWQARSYQCLSFPWLARIARQAGSFDVVHLVESRSLQTALYGTLLRLHPRLPIVHSAFGAVGAKTLGWKHRLYDRTILRPLLVDRCSRLLAQTEHEIESYVDFLGEAVRRKVAIVPLGVDVANARASAERHRGELRRRLELGPETPLVIYLGRLTPKKGVERLVRCFTRAAAGTDAHLALVGYDEGSKASIEAEIARQGMQARCHVLGPEHGGTRFGYYADADLYAITSTYYEETSLASLEALAVGTPCLVTPEVELPFLEAAGAGRMPESSEDAITEALGELLSDPARMRAMRSNALALADQRYDIDAVARTLAAEYDQVRRERSGSLAASVPAPDSSASKRPFDQSEKTQVEAIAPKP